MQINSFFCSLLKFDLFEPFLLLFKYSCLHFHPPHPIHPCLPPSYLPPLTLSMCPFHMFLDGPSLIIPYYHSPPSSLVAVSFFFISMSLLIFCLLVCDTVTQWNTMEQKERRRSYPLQQYGWMWRALC